MFSEFLSEFVAAKLGWSPNRGIKVRFACFVCQESFYINIGGDGTGLGGGSRQIGPRTIGPRTVGPRTTGPRTVGPRGPTVRGPICHGQLGPGQLGPGAQLVFAMIFLVFWMVIMRFGMIIWYLN